MIKIGIYSIYCTKNGKVYIGSSTDIFIRWNGHRCNLRLNKHGNRYLQNAWNKYEEESFVFSIVEECSKDILIEREQFYLDQIFESGNTFNMQKNANGCFGKPLSEETKKKLSNVNKGRKLPPRTLEHSRKISEAKKGIPLSEKAKLSSQIAAENRRNNYKPMSESNKQKLIEANKGKPRSEETKRKISEAHKVRKAKLLKESVSRDD